MSAMILNQAIIKMAGGETIIQGRRVNLSLSNLDFLPILKVNECTITQTPPHCKVLAC